MEREAMEFDVVIVGAGPAGLSTACRIMQLASENGQALSVCVIEKGSEVGAHILSGAVLDPKALNELFPDWVERRAPLTTEVQEDEIYFLRDSERAVRIPNSLVPYTMHNHGNYVVSLGNVCRWLAEQAESMGVEIFPGFAASEILYDDLGAVCGVVTGDMGVNQYGEQKHSFMPGMELRARYTVFAEGCRGHLGKQLVERFALDKGVDPQHYGLGIKEIWEVPAGLHSPGLVLHATGWPLQNDTSGGAFLYHGDGNQVVVGLIVDLGYSNPHLSPFDEFQRMKHHPVFSQHLRGGKRISYGARAIAKGGLNSLPKMHFPGGLLIGCDAGTLNFAKIKGSHTAMKSGMLAAESLYAALSTGNSHTNLTEYADRFRQSWVYTELNQSRNFGPAIHKFGALAGGMFNYVDQNWFKGKLPFTLHEPIADFAKLKPASESKKITYPKPDGVLSFDKLSSVFLSNTNHEEDQPCHLRLKSAATPIEYTLPLYDEPAQRYCPAGVYEVVTVEGESRLQINAQNCLHCKTCDIKDPAQNISWMVPEGGGGPNYPNM